MAIHFIDNYSKTNLDSVIVKRNGTPLRGEIWVYEQFLKFNEHEFLKNETWFVKHSYNLSKHPSSEGKVEGQIDFLVLNKNGLLIIEVKGGGIEVENDTYYSYESSNRTNRYESQNPFIQAKEYVHSLKYLLDSNPFIYRAVVFPHESGFKLISPQLIGYTYLFFSKNDLDRKESEFGKSKIFFDFLQELGSKSRRNIIFSLHPSIDKIKLEKSIWESFPELTKIEISRLKAELFPTQTSYGFNPDKIKNDIILNENYEILKGLRKNRRLMIQGAPGTGKTILATKFLAENILKQQRGIFFCSNKLLRSKMEYLITDEHKLDPNLISFKIFYEGLTFDEIDESADYIIIDEAQEFFDKGLFEFIEMLNTKINFPKILILYDPDQTIVQNYKDVDWYADFFIDSGFVHYLFDTVWRCAQNPEILDIVYLLKTNQFHKVLTNYANLITKTDDTISKLKSIKEIIDSSNLNNRERMILIDSSLIEDFRKIATNYFKQELDELTETNINIVTDKIRYTTPIKYRGLECEEVTIVTSNFSEKTKIQNYIGSTRAIYKLNFLLWAQQ